MRSLLALFVFASLSAFGEEESLSTTALGLFKTGGPLMYPLAICSCVVVWLTVYSFFETRKGKFIPKGFPERLEAVLYKRDLKATLDLLALSKSVLALVLAPGIEKLKYPLDKEERQQAEEAVLEKWEGKSIAMQFWFNLLPFRYSYLLPSIVNAPGACVKDCQRAAAVLNYEKREGTA